VLAGIAVLAFPVGVWPVYRFGRRLRKLSKQGQEEIGMLAALLNEAVLGNRVVKLFGREKFEQERFELENEKLTKTFVRSEKLRALTGPVNEALASFAIAAVVLYGGFSVMNGYRSQGEFIAFLIAVFLLYDPFKKLSRVSSVVQQGLAGAQRIFEVLDSEPSVSEPLQPIALAVGNSIKFENVSFRYREISPQAGGAERPPALEDVELLIEEGTKVAIVGFSGAGKTTLVDLIPRFMDPTRGRITIGGVDISKVGLKELRQRIAMVSQHTFLFNDSVYNNIAYGKPSATREEVLAAARAAHAADFIAQLPQGYDTILGEAGLSLSGGERQRVAIARAILKDAPILILDEATASLDNRSEREVQQALEQLLRGRTAIIIAHRLSTVRNANRIVVMRDGRIVEHGTHDELLALSGEYAKLHALQFAAIEAPEGSSQPVWNRLPL
ncbi:MAG: ATP-binding cassette domain-containing protein, partial [Oligoflexia bacterium]|nr:ATP-binding cassette domain-containing protein [Oligoflexia bacterium]